MCLLPCRLQLLTRKGLRQPSDRHTQITSGLSKAGIRNKKSLMKEDDVDFMEVVAQLIIRGKKR